MGQKDETKAKKTGSGSRISPHAKAGRRRGTNMVSHIDHYGKRQWTPAKGEPRFGFKTGREACPAPLKAWQVAYNLASDFKRAWEPDPFFT